MVRVAHLSDLHVAHVVPNIVRLGQLLFSQSAGQAAWDIGARIVSATWLKRTSLFEPFVRSSHLIPAYQTRHLVAVVQSVREQKCDHVIITGDVANLGAESELSEAKMVLTSFGYEGSVVTIVPGNHDVVNLFGIAEFQKVMHLEPFPHLSWISPDIVVLALDSTVFGSELDWRDVLGINARGGFSDSDLQQADALLSSVPNNVFKILCCHHHLVDLPPDGYIDEWADKFDPRQAGCANRSNEMLDIAQKHHVRLILFGHRHRATHHLFSIRAIPASCSGAVTERNQRGNLRYRIFDLDGGAIRRRTWIEVNPKTASEQVVTKIQQDVCSMPRGNSWKTTYSVSLNTLQHDFTKAKKALRQRDRHMLHKLKQRIEKQNK